MRRSTNERPSSVITVLTPVSFQVLGVCVLMIFETSIELNTTTRAKFRPTS